WRRSRPASDSTTAGPSRPTPPTASRSSCTAAAGAAASTSGAACAPGAAHATSSFRSVEGTTDRASARTRMATSASNARAEALTASRATRERSRRPSERCRRSSLLGRVGPRARYSAAAVALVAAAVATVLIARGGSDGGQGAGQTRPQKVLPNGRAGAPQRPGKRRAAPKPYGARWSIFEDHNAMIRNGAVRRQQTLDELKVLGADTL